jgi:CRISPR-associated protein Cmr2
VSEVFWQAKIWGLLHDPALKALHNNSGRGKEGAWESLQCMNGWVSPKDKSALKTEQFSRKWLNHVGLCDLISSASDRAAVGRLSTNIDYNSDGIQIRHLLSGEPQTLKLGQWHDYLMNLGSDRADWLTDSARVKWLTDIEASLIPDFIKQETDPRKVYWWLWRCYPEALSKALDRDNNTLNEPRLPLLPAETRLPDGSLWSHATMTSALAGSLAGYHKDAASYPKKRQQFIESRPYVATFSFTPVQELIKASRKMRDFWAGSWLLHYLSAKVCWDIAWKYGPDTLLYPCLYEQPLIDLWLLEKYPDFYQWINPPEDNRRLLTAGFPNVLVMILPDNGTGSNTSFKNPVKAAMQQAEQSLTQEWQRLGNLVLQELQGETQRWMHNLNHHTWDGWLKAQWQTYWVALPIGDRNKVLHHSPRQEKTYKEWLQNQNEFACPKAHLFKKEEKDFLKATYELALKEYWQKPSTTKYKPKQPNFNVGSWWASIFDQTRLSLNAVKNVRTWQLPTAFGPRSTISGIGPVVHPIYDSAKPDWATEGDTANDWSKDNHKGLFDGIEQLNATEVLKRGLHRILPRVLFPNSFNNPSQNQLQTQKFAWYYPDLSSGVAGWLRQMEREKKEEAITYYQRVCNKICHEFPWANQNQDSAAKQPWGIPWIATHHQDWLNPRLLNAGWLIEDFKPSNPNPNQLFTILQKREETQKEQKRLREFITKCFPSGNNPTDWYVIAAGDGDGMSEWLKGKHLGTYNHYIPDALKLKINQLPEQLQQPFNDFIQVQKRMGPATHSALSRALLDFSNQLVPYLTEERYAGRLIYGGGDDVLAYTNLWEWDSWLWDIRQCFRGQEDPKNEFTANGDYWNWGEQNRPKSISERPLFTMGHQATISFGITIAHHSVPLAITLENLWEAEKEAKEHKYKDGCNLHKKDAVQVRVLYGNGNILKATAKFKAFHLWQQLINNQTEENSAIFEQAATIWSQHPAPVKTAIEPWTKAFCSRREMFAGDELTRDIFQQNLAKFLEALWQTTLANKQDQEIQNWLKLAAFVIRKRTIKLGGLA